MPNEFGANYNFESADVKNRGIVCSNIDTSSKFVKFACMENDLAAFAASWLPHCRDDFENCFVLTSKFCVSFFFRMQRELARRSSSSLPSNPPFLNCTS